MTLRRRRLKNMRCGQTEIFKREGGVRKVKAIKNIIGKQKPISFAYTYVVERKIGKGRD